jgi:hypothetical protein
MDTEKLPLIVSNQRVYGFGLFRLLDVGSRRNKGLVDIYDPKTPNMRKLFGQGGKLAVSDFEVGNIYVKLNIPEVGAGG